MCNVSAHICDIFDTGCSNWTFSCSFIPSVSVLQPLLQLRLLSEWVGQIPKTNSIDYVFRTLISPRPFELIQYHFPYIPPTAPPLPPPEPPLRRQPSHVENLWSKENSFTTTVSWSFSNQSQCYMHLFTVVKSHSGIIFRASYTLFLTHTHTHTHTHTGHCVHQFHFVWKET